MDIGLAEIDRWHRQKGWLRIGYHYVIRRSGETEYGRPIDSVGAHVHGFNDISVGICLVGGVAALMTGGTAGAPAENNFTDAQMAALETLVTSLHGRWPAAKIIGHRDLDPKKECPSFDAAAWWAACEKAQSPRNQKEVV